MFRPAQVLGLLAAAAALFVLTAEPSAQVPGTQPAPGVRTLPPIRAVPAPAPSATVRPGTAPAGTRLPRAPGPDIDADGDGARASEDCADNDASRFPGNVERPNDRDEDCDPQSIGELDRDQDGYTDVSVSNWASYGPRSGPTGTDCNDSEAGIRPDAQELPNRIDDDCDGIVDDLLGTWWTPR